MGHFTGAEKRKSVFRECTLTIYLQWSGASPLKGVSFVNKCILLPSAVCDIGSASFKYDMRRLSEILAFPRAWYRRSIARRLFLGDQTINLPGAWLKMPSLSL